MTRDDRVSGKEGLEMGKERRKLTLTKYLAQSSAFIIVVYFFMIPIQNQLSNFTQYKNKLPALSVVRRS